MTERDDVLLFVVTVAEREAVLLVGVAVMLPQVADAEAGN
jgi:hypothetical protein